jgi:hypothetical protein
MPTMIDIIGATILAGMVMLIIVGVTANLNQTLYMSTFSLNVQTSAIALARIIEHDFYKMGYDISKSSPVILQADSNCIRFWMGRIQISGATDTTRVTYYSGATTDPIVSTTRNPRDRMFYRVEEGSTISANVGVTRFSLAYFDSAGIQLSATNLPLSERLRIKAIRVKIFIESPEPVGRYSDPADTTYMGVYWEKLIYPRNL